MELKGGLWDGQARTWSGSYTPAIDAVSVSFNSRYWLPGVTTPHENLDVVVTLVDVDEPTNPPTPPAPPPPGPSGSALGGYVWLDANGDGQRTANEAGDVDRLIQLFRCVPPWGIAATASSLAPDGVFSFAGVSPGEYQIGTDVPSLGFSPVGGDNQVFTNGFSNCFLFDGSPLALGVGVLGDAPTAPESASRIVGFAWIDANADGVLAATEAPEVNREVTLFRCGPPWGSVGSATTDAAGRFEIDGLDPGEYQLGTAVPAAGFSPIGADNRVHPSGFANCVSTESSAELGIGVRE